MKTPTQSRALEWITLIMAAFLVGLILWLLFGRGRKVLSEAVSVRLGEQTVIPAEEGTGHPQFDSRIPASVPRGERLVPFDFITGKASNFPKGASCPIGFRMWKDLADGKLWCVADVN